MTGDVFGRIFFEDKKFPEDKFSKEQESTLPDGMRVRHVQVPHVNLPSLVAQGQNFVLAVHGKADEPNLALLSIGPDMLVFTAFTD